MDGVDLIRKVQELSRELSLIPHLNELYRQAVQGLLDPLGFDRAAILLYDPLTHEMRGTWGTSERGKLVDESWYRSYVGIGKAFLTEALAQPDRIKVWEDRELKQGEKTIGRGWNVMVVLQDGQRTIGWISVDNHLNHRDLTPLEREVLALYGRTLASLIQQRQYADLVEKYKSQNELKDRLFTILAHDLRGPIGNLSVMLGLACDQPMESDQLHELLGEGRQAALRTYNLLENVLGWVRGQIEEVTALRERLPLVRVLISVQIWLEAQAKTKGVHLQVDCPETITVVSDERMLETIVRNLVSNAVKYSPTGATVALRGRLSDGWVLVEVVDHGVGLTPEKKAGLFGGKQSTSQPGTAGEGGSGLGLMFSSDLAKTLGGRMEVDSQPGQGSTFRIVLPDELDGEL